MENKNIYESVVFEYENESEADKKALIVYDILCDKSLRNKIDKVQQKDLFNKIEGTTKMAQKQEVVAAWWCLGDCYYHAYGCKKSIGEAIACFNMVLENNSDYAKEEWWPKAGSRLGNIYIGQEEYDKAKKYIHMSTNPKDYQRLANHLWEKGDERGALEDYKKSGALGRIKSYAKAVKLCLKSNDPQINEKAEEFAIMFLQTDADKKYKQEVADLITCYYYEKLRNADPNEKDYINKQFDRFKVKLDGEHLKKKSESVVQKIWNKQVRDSVVAAGVVTGLGVAVKIGTKIAKKLV